MSDLIVFALLHSVPIAPLNVAFIVLEPHVEARPAANYTLTKYAESILRDLQRNGQLRYRRAHLADDAISNCLRFALNRVSG